MAHPASSIASLIVLTPRLTPMQQAIYDYWTQGKPIEIELNGLVFRAINATDIEYMKAVYTDPDMMKMILDHDQRIQIEGLERWKELQAIDAVARVQQLIERWKTKDPFSGFMIIKKDTGETIGDVVSGHCNPFAPGCSEIAYRVIKPQWNRRFGTQAARFIMDQYLPALIGVYKAWKGEYLQIDGGRFCRLAAMARVDHRYSLKIIRSLGMKEDQTIVKYGVSWITFLYEFQDIKIPDLTPPKQQ
jgi:RimJ/RimL family protein N-acetyltransferase